MMISLFDRAENTVGKGENADNQHFLLFPSVFKGFFLRVVKSLDCLVKSKVPFNLLPANLLELDKSKILPFGKELTIYHTIPGFKSTEEEAFCKHCWKRRNDVNQQFLLFPQCFLSYGRQLPQVKSLPNDKF